MRELTNSANVREYLEQVGAPVALHIDELLRDETTRWAALDAALVQPLTTLSDFVRAGGKRLRPAFCHVAFVGAGGHGRDTRIVAAGAALEMLHSFALIHDDVMDGAMHRRGQNAVHIAYGEVHAARQYRGEAARFGEAVAILIGDMAFVYADRLMQDAGDKALEVFNEMRIELNIGQYLDIAATATHDVSLDTATRIARYKSGKYTVERPMHLGLALAGKFDELASAASAYGEPVGEAFQLRDDILGAIGDPGVVGKPVGGDILEGKPTALLALAQSRATVPQAEVLAKHYGNAHATEGDIARVQAVLIETGAVREVEERITRLTDTGIAAAKRLAFDAESHEMLIGLAHFVAGRAH